MARNPKSERMLPGDYSRKVKYDSLDNTQKRIKHGGEDALKLLSFPEDLRGEQFKERPFLVFYFDDADDYQLAREYFEIPTHKAVSHPELDANRLVALVRGTQEPVNDE